MIPVAYGGQGGPDLPDVARQAGLDPADVVRRHHEATYRVGAIGFAPGFAYLTGLPPDLATPRRATPRVRVPVGSVGIGGAQTGVYTCPTPGGWSLIGRTDLRLFDPEREPPALLAVGDRVRFEPAPARRSRVLDHAVPAPSQRDPTRAFLEILSPGLLTTVQDLGRPGHGRIGVAPGGAADKASLVRGNRLAGNPDGAAGLEITINGPHLRFLRPGRIVISGANLGARLNGDPLPVEAVRVVRPGDELTFEGKPRQGARAYLCVSGGYRRAGTSRQPLDRPRRAIWRSRGTPPAAGAIALRAAPAATPWSESGSIPSRVIQARSGSHPGPQANRFDEDAWHTAAGSGTSPFRRRPTGRESGSMAPSFRPDAGADIVSQGVVTGAIQVTGSGQPIVMLPSRATIGGYPQIATVIAADLDRLGQLRPGDTIRFEESPWNPVPGL